VKTRMKLAPGSMWDDFGNVCNRDKVTVATIQSIPLGMFASHCKANRVHSFSATDAIAVIDAAGLDKVRAAARELRELWVSLDPRCQNSIPDYVAEPVLRLCRVLDEETETDG
jgi:hypothetical protein